MDTLVHKSAIAGQPSASTFFDLVSIPGQPVFSWDQVTVSEEKDDFFKLKGKIEDQPKSVFLFKLD